MLGCKKTINVHISRNPFLFVFQKNTQPPIVGPGPGHEDFVKLFRHEGKVLRFKAKFANPKPEATGLQR